MVMPLIDSGELGVTQAEADEAARRRTVPPPPDVTNPEFKPTRARRKVWTVGEKLRILRLLDAAGRGQIGEILHREGLHATMASKWRKEQLKGTLDPANPVKRGPEAVVLTPEQIENAMLRKENAVLKAQLQMQKDLVEFQKKIANLYGVLAD